MSAPQIFVQGQGSVSGPTLNTFPQICATAAQLRTGVGLTNMSVLLLGLAAVDDGGGGYFFWDGSSNAPDDGNDVIRPLGQIVGAWLRLSIAGDFAVPYTVAFEFLGGTPPGVSEVLGAHTFFSTVTMPANFAGGVGTTMVNPTGTFTAGITRNGTTVGTMVISTGGAFSFTSTSGAALTFPLGDNIVFTAPISPDATLSNFSWTIQGTLS